MIIVDEKQAEILLLDKRVNKFPFIINTLPTSIGLIPKIAKVLPLEMFMMLKKINDTETNFCAIAERKMLQTIGGDCDTAVGGLAEIKNNNLRLKAQLFSDNGDECFEHELTGKDHNASLIGKSVGEKLLKLAGEKFKKK